MSDNPRWRRRPEGSTWGDFGPDDQLGRLNLITHLLESVPYTPLEPRSVELPERPPDPGDVELDLAPYTVPAAF